MPKKLKSKAISSSFFIYTIFVFVSDVSKLNNSHLSHSNGMYCFFSYVCCTYCVYHSPRIPQCLRRFSFIYSCFFVIKYWNCCCPHRISCIELMCECVQYWLLNQRLIWIFIAHHLWSIQILNGNSFAIAETSLFFAWRLKK